MLEIEKSALQTRKAAVVVQGNVAGYLEMIAADEFQFTYLDEYVEKGNPPISLTMPISKKKYFSETLHPFFNNLIFEGEQLRTAEKKYKLNRYSMVDRFKLLMVTGSHNLSNISVQPVVQGSHKDLTSSGVDDSFAKQFVVLESPFERHCEICLEAMKEGKTHSTCRRSLWDTTSSIKLEAYLEEPANIFKTNAVGQSVSGAQRKSLFCLKGDTLFKAGYSTHLLKPEGEFPEMPANEHLTMIAARKIGFNTPPVGLYNAAGIGLIYVVKRFVEGENFIVHEDFAQLSEDQPTHKDQGSLEEVANVISKFATSPKIELADFFRRVLFCYLTGNGDMHLKNWSLSSKYGREKLVKLSPVCDFLNVRASFPQEQVESILTLGGVKTD